MFILIVPVVLGGVAWYVMTPSERARALRAARTHLHRAISLTAQAHRDPFLASLRERTRWAIVTPLLATIAMLTFLLMAAAPGSIDDPSTLLAWGASVGPRTTNGEWWRLVTALFVHAGPLSLIVNLAALTLPGVVLERLVGRAAFAGTCLAAGVFANLVSLAEHPVAITAGAAPMVAGVYGLLAAATVAGWIRPSAIRIPWTTLRSVAPTAIVFALDAWLGGTLERGSAVAAVAVGLCAGIVLTIRTAEGRAPVRRVATVMAVAAVIIVAAVLPLRGMANVQPEIDRIVTMEQRTTAIYEAAVARFREGSISAKALADVIDRSIRPEFRAAQARLQGLARVPREQQPTVADAAAFLSARDESWRMRADALHRGKMTTLHQADRREHEALDLFDRLTSESR